MPYARPRPPTHSTPPRTPRIPHSVHAASRADATGLGTLNCLRLIQRYIGNILLRRRQIRRSLRRRMIPPRPRGVKIRRQRRTQPRRHPLAHHLQVPVLIEQLVHTHHHQHRVHRLPRLRLVAQQSKLRRQILLMLVYESVHAPRKVLEILLVAIAQRRRQPFCIRANSQHPLRSGHDPQVSAPEAPPPRPPPSAAPYPSATAGPAPSHSLALRISHRDSPLQCVESHAGRDGP